MPVRSSRTLAKSPHHTDDYHLHSWIRGGASSALSECSRCGCKRESFHTKGGKYEYAMPGTSASAEVPLCSRKVY